MIVNMISTEIVTTVYLIRYGAIPDVIPGDWAERDRLVRGSQVVIRNARGETLGTVLEEYRPRSVGGETESSSFSILRRATPDDIDQSQRLLKQSRSEYPVWCQRIADWNLDLQLIDLEWTLDESRLILYVLNDRGPECTKLALQAAAAGLGAVDVLPVSAEGLVTLPKESKGGGCGSCGCH